MSQSALLIRVVEALDRAGIDYMLTGSVASSLQGEPRSTHDLDVVVAVGEKDVGALLQSFPRPTFYHDASAVRDAVRSGGMFNVIDVENGDKVDFWLLTDEPFDRSRFDRKYQEEVFGVTLKISAPEDTILAKLRWSKMAGGSEKYFMDALRIYEVQTGVLDEEYIEDWAERLGVADLWIRLVSEAETES